MLFGSVNDRSKSYVINSPSTVGVPPLAIKQALASSPVIQFAWEIIVSRNNSSGSGLRSNSTINAQFSSRQSSICAK